MTPPSTHPAETLEALRLPLVLRLLLGVFALLLLLGAAVHVLLKPQPALARALQADFDADQAMTLAGDQVPVEVESFYFFLLDTSTTVEMDAREMAGKMRLAARDGEFLGIAGPDPQRNLATLLAALQDTRRADLEGLVVIYLGPSAHRSTLAEALGKHGAQLRFVEFPPLSSI